MTNAIDLAAEALQRAKKSLCNWTPRYRFIDDALIDLDKALAALTAEQSRVPLDRERLAKRLEEAATDGWPFSPEMSHPLDCSDLVEATTLLRQPVAAEVEAMAKRLDGVAYILVMSDFANAPETIREAASLLRRLSLPAVGEWRPIESAPKWEGECGPEVLIWDHATCIARQFAEWTYDHYHRSEKNPWVIGGGHVKHPTHWQPLPSPPSPEEPGR